MGACDGACCGAFAASSSFFDAACNNLSAHPVLLHGCDTTAELHIRSTSHYIVRSCTTAELHIRSTSHYIVRSCAYRKLRLCSASHYFIRSSGNVCIASCGRLRVCGAIYHRSFFLEPSVRGAHLEGHLSFASCLTLDVDGTKHFIWWSSGFPYNRMNGFNPC